MGELFSEIIAPWKEISGVIFFIALRGSFLKIKTRSKMIALRAKKFSHFAKNAAPFWWSGTLRKTP